MSDVLDVFVADVARHVMQAAWRTIYSNDSDEPTVGSIAIIDAVIATAHDQTLRLGRRIERVENMLTQYLQVHRAVPDASAIVLRFNLRRE